MKKVSDIYNKYREIILYLIFGFFTTLISLVVYYGLVITVINPDNGIELQVANIISWVVGVLFAYVTNRRYVFKSRNNKKLEEFIKFTGARVSTLLLDMVIMFIFVTMLKYNDKIFKIVSQILVIIGNYILSKLFIFNKNLER